MASLVPTSTPTTSPPHPTRPGPGSPPGPEAPPERLAPLEPPDQAVSRAERSIRTARLLRAAHGCSDPVERQALLDQVVVLNRGVAQAIAARYRGRGVDLEDLEQTAYEGLVKAVQRFDPAVRPDLLTFAVPTIRGEIQRWFRDKSWTIRPPRRIQDLQHRIGTAADELRQDIGREPTRTEVADAVGSSVREVEEAEEWFGCFEPASLDARVGGAEGLTLADVVGGRQDTQGPVDARLALEPLLLRLGRRDRQVLFLRFHLDRTQQEIGQDLGITQTQVSRLLSQILRQLRGDLAEEGTLPAEE